MKVSQDGGETWTVDLQLTRLVTNDGALSFFDRFGGSGGTQVHTIAFNPRDSREIAVGTDAGGVIATSTGGRSWTRIVNSTRATNISSFYFDTRARNVYVSTYGRGLWRFDADEMDLGEISQP